jgi:hypothetical protein
MVEWWIRKDWEESGHGLIEVLFLNLIEGCVCALLELQPFIRSFGWRGWGKSLKPSVRMPCVSVEFRTDNLPNISLDRYSKKKICCLLQKSIFYESTRRHIRLDSVLLNYLNIVEFSWEIVNWTNDIFFWEVTSSVSVGLLMFRKRQKLSGHLHTSTALFQVPVWQVDKWAPRGDLHAVCNIFVVNICNIILWKYIYFRWSFF